MRWRARPVALGALAALAALTPACRRPPATAPPSTSAAPGPPALDFARIGVTHWDARYHFTDRPILEEGADRIWDLGARVIKLELEVGGKYQREYPFNHEWREHESVRDLVADPYYVAAIHRPWRWVNFQIGVSQRAVPVEWCDGMTQEEVAAEREAFYALTRHLLEAYRESGITFLLDHWEGDNALHENPCYPQGGGGADWTVRDGMVRWLGARQAGIVAARAEVGEHGVRVLGGAECNSTPDHEWPPGTGSRCGHDVLPYIDPPPDLCGLSAYRDERSTDMGAALAWLRERCNARRATPSPLGDQNVYVAELGAPAREVGDARQLAITRAQTESALAHGAALVIYWQLFSNECVAGCPNDPVRDEDVRGFWLVRPEPRERGGTPTPTWDWMASVLAGERARPPPAADGRAVRLVARASGRCVAGARPARAGGLRRGARGADLAAARRGRGARPAHDVRRPGAARGGAARGRARGHRVALGPRAGRGRLLHAGGPGARAVRRAHGRDVRRRAAPGPRALHGGARAAVRGAARPGPALSRARPRAAPTASRGSSSR
ncbi:MAG: hypothetical protein KF729_10890 [Sandaracinaceae bacterium]|nr:hypothetical protein [Sandaracinaceae bacterium]